MMDSSSKKQKQKTAYWLPTSGNLLPAMVVIYDKIERE